MVGYGAMSRDPAFGVTRLTRLPSPPGLPVGAPIWVTGTPSSPTGPREQARIATRSATPTSIVARMFWPRIWRILPSARVWRNGNLEYNLAPLMLQDDGRRRWRQPVLVFGLVA